MRIAILPIFLALALTTGLSSCGVKPHAVDPPASVTNDVFPKTYPDPATDPQPTAKPSRP